MDTTNRKGMEKLYLKRLFILLFLFPASLWAQDALSETPVRSTDTEAINEIVTGLNTVWMLLAAMLVFFHATGIRFGGSWIYPHQEYRQRTDEESD